jgi:hypothetical protein
MKKMSKVSKSEFFETLLKINKINKIYRESLNFKSAFEVYNNLCQINLDTLN